MRVPSFTELYYADPTTVGDPELSAERSLSYEADYSFKRGGIAAGFGVFFRDEHDMIDWVKASASQARFQAQNIGRDYVSGIEGRFNFSPSSWLGVDTGYTYVNRYTGTSGLIYKYGINYARHLADTKFRFNLPFGTQTFSLSYKKKPARPGWLIANVRLVYDLNKTVQLFGEVTNLFNKGYEEIEGIPQPGRWLQAGLRFEW
jgi:iron complex outermembrane receptor protein